MQKRKVWSNPYPKWVKTHSTTARNLVIILVMMISLGLIYSYARVSIWGPYSGIFRNFPEVGSLFPVALETAIQENPDAQLAMIMVEGKEVFDVYETHDPELDYKTRFYFCSPNDEKWTLQVDVIEEGWGIFEKGKITKVRSVPENRHRHFLPNCETHIINEVPKSLKPIADSMRTNNLRSRIGILEFVPRIMWMKRNPDLGVYWTALFKYKHEDQAFGIMIDSSGNELKNVDDLRYPFNWQTGDLSDYP